MSKKIYASATERQRACRSRKKARLLMESLPPTPAPTQRRVPSRPARLAALVLALRDLQHEYERWLERLPENLADAAIADQLTTTVEQLEEAGELLDAIEPPKGFGRD